MFKINLYSVGKNKETWLEQALSLYQKRLQNQLILQFNWVKHSDQLIKLLEKEKNIICFDPLGKALTSEDFAETIKQSLIKGGSQLTLLIGGAEGIPEVFKSCPLISLSKMIFTHQMTRLIVTEQIYRATQIWSNSPYHFS